MWTDSDIRKVARRIYNRDLPTESLAFNLDEFRKLYQVMTDWMGGYQKVTLVKTFGEEVVGQFTTIAPYRFYVEHENELGPDDFDFIPEHMQVWHNVVEGRTSFPAFLWGEFQKNHWKLLSVFSAFALLLFIANDDELYSLLSTLLIQSSTIFVSIFLIFTVTQNHLVARDQELFELGITYKYQQDDRNVAILAIMTVALTFVATLSLSIFDKYPDLLSLQVESVNIGVRLWKALTFATVITLLFDGFMAVTSYYLYRNLDVIERDLLREILIEEWKKRGSEEVSVTDEQ